MASMSEKKSNCELCQKSKPDLHCNSCGISVCRACAGDHISSQLNLQHSIVSFELRNAKITNLRCSNHITFSCELLCEDCNTPVCTQCYNDAHQGHQVIDIEEFYVKKQDAIKNNNDILEKAIDEYNKNIAEIKVNRSELTDEFEELRKGIFKQGQVWHKEVDELVSKYNSEINKLETNQINTLTQQILELENGIVRMRKVLRNSVDILNSNDGRKLVSYDSTKENTKLDLDDFYFTPPIFSPNLISQNLLSELFGSFDPPLFPTTGGFTVPRILSTPDEIDVISTGYRYLCGITCLGAKQAWLSQNSRIMRKIDQGGSLVETVTSKYDEMPYDMTVTKQGYLAYAVRTEVFRVVEGKTETFITLKNWETLGICSTLEDDLLVCMKKSDYSESKVVRYSGSVAKQEIIHDNEGRNLYGLGSLFVTESASKDVWVSDREAKAVVVTDQLGKLRFRYTGNLEVKQFKSFAPWCIDSDRYGHVYVIDLDGECVRILGEEGNLVSYIVHLEGPQDLSLDSDDHVWICGSSGKVKVFKCQE